MRRDPIKEAYIFNLVFLLSLLSTKPMVLIMRRVDGLCKANHDFILQANAMPGFEASGGSLMTLPEIVSPNSVHFVGHSFFHQIK